MNGMHSKRKQNVLSMKPKNKIRNSKHRTFVIKVNVIYLYFVIRTLIFLLSMFSVGDQGESKKDSGKNQKITG